jgi:aminoglycoside phosphotransferase (APT) family kinase protein
MPARPDRIDDLVGFARSLARFLTALRGIDPRGAPLAGAHSAYRGAPLLTYDADARRAIDELGDCIPSRAATTMWEAALDATTTDAPVWVHGDIAAGNLLVAGGQLSAVIDFGCSGVGDPACDLAIAWTLLRGPSRHAFREELGVGDAEWARGRGWVLWKTLITLAGSVDAEPVRASAVLAETRSVLAELLEAAPA